MACHPRQTMKGTTVEHKLSLPELHHFVGYLRKEAKAVLKCSPRGLGNTRPREHDENAYARFPLRSFFA